MAAFSDFQLTPQVYFKAQRIENMITLFLSNSKVVAFHCFQHMMLQIDYSPKYSSGKSFK